MTKIADIGKHVKFVIQDDGVVMDEEKLSHILSGNGGKSKRTGLVNTNRRLAKMYGNGLPKKARPFLS